MVTYVDDDDDQWEMNDKQQLYANGMPFFMILLYLYATKRLCGLLEILFPLAQFVF